MERIIGFSTGACYKFLNPLSPETVRFIYSLGCNAIEINWHSRRDSIPTEIIIALDSLLFESVSLHLPCDMIYGNNALSNYIALQTSLFIEFYDFNHILIHPNLIDDFGVFCKRLCLDSTIIAIENMDDRKDSFQDLSSLLDFFKNHKASLTFDINHWIINGNPPTSIPDTLNKLRLARVELAGIHLSGLGFHEPLFKSNSAEIVQLLRCLPPNIPIIIESICQNKSEMEKELAFIKMNLQD